MFKKNIFLAVLVLLSQLIFGQGQIKIESTDIVSSSAPASPLLFESPTLNYKVNEAYLNLRLSLGEIHKLGVQDVDYTAPVEITVSFVGNGQANEVVLLQLEEDQPVQLAKIALLGDVKSLTDVSITANLVTAAFSLSCVNTGCQLAQYQDYIERNIELDVYWDLDLGIDVKTTPTSSNLSVYTENIVQPIGERVLSFNWSNGNYEFPNYQIQILRLYNISHDLAEAEEQIEAELNWSEATQLETMSPITAMELTIAEGTGFYAWRIRPVGTYYEGGVSNPLNHGVWSYDEGNLIPATIYNKSSVSSDANFFFFDDPDDQRNYSYNRVFTEGNKTSEVITYANNLQQVRQTQAYIKSNDTSGNDHNTLIVSQNIIDYSGRPSLSTMAVPTDGRMKEYKEQFIKSSSNQEIYRAIHFDVGDGVDDNYNNPSPIYDAFGEAMDYYGPDTINLMLKAMDLQGCYMITMVLIEQLNNQVLERLTLYAMMASKNIPLK